MDSLETEQGVEGNKTKTEIMTSPCDVQGTHGTLWGRW